MGQSPLVKSTAIGTVLQVLMVVAGHYSPQIAQLFAVGGTGISAVAGVLFAQFARGTLSNGSAASGGAVAGGVSALLGILVSVMLGDVPPSLLALGTASSTVAGVIGGLIGRAVTARRAA